MIKITKTTDDVKKGALYAGTHIPQGAQIIGTVHRGDGDTGALVQLANGTHVQINNGCIRSLPGKKGRPLKYDTPTLPKTIRLTGGTWKAVGGPRGAEDILNEHST